MKKLYLIIAPLFLIALSLPTFAQQLSFQTISGYLNSLKTVQADFTQINDDSTISTGQIFIRRPGRVRFEYNPPDASLVLASQGQVAIFDAKSNQPPEQFPLTRTPLNLILAPNINLGRAKMVVGHGYDGTSTTVTAQDPEYPEYGSIQMVFTGNPVQLRQWIISDGSGLKTTVILGELKEVRSIQGSKFSIDSELDRRGF